MNERTPFEPPSDGPPPITSNRDILNEVLKKLEADDGDLRKRLADNPRATLKELGIEGDVALDALSAEWGLGPLADCGGDTCRLTQACGWTVCGKTTNSCASAEDELRIRMDQVLDQVNGDAAFRHKLVTDPIETLKSIDFDDPTARYVADSWGIGPSADCGDTCRLTQACGWTVCGKTTNSCASAEDELRNQMDEVLGKVQNDASLRQKLVTDPIETLQSLNFDPSVTRYVADSWGIGPSADCGSDTCRLTQACGWTVCGKTTNSCASEEDELRIRMDQVLDQVKADDGFRERLIDSPIKTLESIDFDPGTARYVADSWGIGPSADCGDTCRLTQACGWTVCGKTTNSCNQGSTAA